MEDMSRHIRRIDHVSGRGVFLASGSEMNRLIGGAHESNELKP